MTQPKFIDLFSAAGFTRTTGKDVVCTVGGFAGSACYRRGAVRLELTNEGLYELDDGTVCLGDLSRLGRHLTLQSVVVDKHARGAGHGRAALADFLAACDGAGLDFVQLEACTMDPRRFGKSAMNAPALVAWYGRHGFALEPLATRVMTRLRPFRPS